MTTQATTEHYKILVFKYGIIAVLMFLEKLEQEQNFEECQKIINAIVELNNTRGLSLPTSVSSDSIEKEIVHIKQHYKQDISRSFLLESSTYYASLINEEVSVLNNPNS